MFPKPSPKKKGTKHRKYLKASKKFLTKKPTCEVCGVNPSTEVHHKKGRMGDLLLDEEFWLAVCTDDHIQIHARPAWAYEKGYLVKRNE